jgi:uncharacterized membrane protein YfcA
VTGNILTFLPPAGDLVLPLIAVLIGGLLRGFTGFGAALVIVPVLGYLFTPQMAVPIHAIMEIPGVLQLMPAAVRQSDRRTVIPMIAALVVAGPAGAFVLASSDPATMRIAVAVLVLVMVGLLASNWRYKGDVGPLVSAAAGGLGGFIQGSAGVGGPPIVAILLSRRDEVGTTRGNILAMMAAVIAVTLASLAAFGLVTMQVVVVGVLASPVFLIATWTGSRYFSRSGDRLYRGASLAVLAATAIFILLASIS